MAKLGLIAGEGELPALVAENASRLGIEVVVVSLTRLLDPRAVRAASRVYSLDLADASDAAPILRREGVSQAVMIGKLWRADGLEGRALHATREIARGRRDMADTTVMLAFVDLLESAGISVVGQLRYLGDAVPAEGLLGRIRPSPEEWEDIWFGLAAARQLAAAGIGQSVVVKNRAVIAVEAAEGTDETIRRAGGMASGCVVVKVAWPGQDERFDVPTVGPDTVEVMRRAGAGVLAVEADRTIVVRRRDALALADAAGIAVVAVAESPEEAGQHEGWNRA